MLSTRYPSPGCHIYITAGHSFFSGVGLLRTGERARRPGSQSAGERWLYLPAALYLRSTFDLSGRLGFALGAAFVPVDQST